MLNPVIAWEPGTLVHYTGSLTGLHGHYHAHPCTCLRCDDPIIGSVRFQLHDDSGTTVASCVRARSITPVDASAVRQPVDHPGPCRPPFLARTLDCDCSRCCAAALHEPGCSRPDKVECTCPDEAEYHLPECPESD
ncbi:hypothetical protein [Streptomyces sp. ZSW22]|uniref:hypothetical protein n=1 Tax=Streptomyces sp. ZSW22 TaxID=3055050 RepID=UPI0025B0A2AA|nr:hypothetical protein [Streptomyces sp. ZSW22]MDN3244150.1 hypothetical protein [Streptomyces sp. ZSW22]